MTTLTLHPSQQPEPRPNGGRMPDGWRPTPPTPTARAAYARRRVAELDETIERAETEGNRGRLLELHDRRARLLKQAHDYDRLAAYRAEHPEQTTPPKRVNRTVVLPSQP